MKNMKIVMIHGAGMDGRVFQGVADRLVGLRGYCVVSCTLPGHGARASDPLLTDIGSMAFWVKETLLDESCILVGHSMGALVAIEASVDARVAGLVLVGAAARMPVNSALLTSAQETPDQARGIVMKWSVYPSAVDLDAINAAMATTMRDAAPQALYNDLNACNAYTGAEARLKNFNRPLLVIHGENDKMVKEADARALAALVPQAVYRVISSCGHMPMLEKTAETADAMERFFETLPG